MFDALQALKEADTLDTLDVVFGEWLARWGGEPVALAGALVSAEVARGHVCLDLATAEKTLRANKLTPPENWGNALATSEAVAQPGGRAPLVQDGNQLYLHRYWCYENRIAAALRKLAIPVARPDASPDANVLKAALGALFPAMKSSENLSFPDAKASKEKLEGGSGRELDCQALAAAVGATRRLAIISGGPGTGKTTTVIELIRLVRKLYPDITIALAAPTGKAASRLSEAFANGGLSEAETFDATPQTLHRLLGYNPATQRLRHHADNPLAVDLIVVDEASMVDIGLMARLVAALKPEARLVLVGDRDQLASVEAGAVFGDICSVAEGFSLQAAQQLAPILGAPLPQAQNEPSPLSDSIVLLTRNYRFRAGNIGELAQAVIAGNAEAALACFDSSPQAGYSCTRSNSLLSGERETWCPVANEKRLTRELERVAKEHFAPVQNAASPEDALKQLARFRLLAAERRGAFGVEGLNARVESLLGIRPNDLWYRGRPVLISENDYELDVFNGDFGVVWPDAEGRDKLWLTGTDGPLKAVSLARLPAHETAWALTVHKAQGSEFDRIALVLPPRKSAVATRELIYTGITRAREAVEVWATEPAFRAAVERRIRRASGLAARLSGSAE